MATISALHLDADRLFPTEPSIRAVARRLYDEVARLPIISPHGHVPARWLADNVPFGDPTALLITPDHYVNRLLHAHGISLSELGVAQGSLSESRSREAFRALCTHWSIYRGTPVRYWLEAQLVEIFGVRLRPSAPTADSIYDQIAEALARPDFLPRELYRRFGIEVLATTDDPCDELAAHRLLAADPSWTGRVIPTFRPDRLLEVGAKGWMTEADRLTEVSGIDTGDYDGFVAALEQRRNCFRAHGAVSADHSHADARTDKLEAHQAADLFALARKGDLLPGEATALRRHLLWEMARMSSEDGLVMTLHPAVSRNHHPLTFAEYGADVGIDIPVATEFTDALRPVLNDFGTNPGFRIVLFTVDEATLSREIAPLAGCYPTVYAGAPWWFLDAPEAFRRYRAAITETAGFGKTSGFIDDTRAFCSIPARHDMSRRLDAGYLAQLVTEGRLAEDEARETIIELVVSNPRNTFRL